MTDIATFVIWKSGTTGLPDEEDNRTKLTRLSLLAVSTDELLIGGAKFNVFPLNFCIDPETGDSFRAEDPTFDEIFAELHMFLESLPKPVCLVAQNGDLFDYPILLAQCNEEECEMPKDLLCVDSLSAFRLFVASHSHNLVTMYEKLTGKEVQAMDYISKSYMLLECIVAISDDFIPWAANNCRLLNSIFPLQRPDISFSEQFN